jgi:hypothetical protein
MNYKKKFHNSISRNISESDLIAFKEYDSSVAVRNKLLYKLGVDISMPIEVIECIHRNLSGKVVEGKLWLAFERLDSEWCKSGFASLEAFIASSNDPTLGKEIATMNSEWT